MYSKFMNVIVSYAWIICIIMTRIIRGINGIIPIIQYCEIK